MVCTHIVEHYLVISSSIKEAQGKPAGDLQEMCQIRNLQFWILIWKIVIFDSFKYFKQGLKTLKI